MQKIVLFIDPNGRAFEPNVKMGNLLMNRFAIDEDVSTEIVKIFELSKEPATMPDLDLTAFLQVLKHKGTDDLIVNN